MKFYAVTLTPSPYKNKYGKKCHSEQRELLNNFLRKWEPWFGQYYYTFEICPTSKNTHVHMCVSPIKDHTHCEEQDIIDHWLEQFTYDFGYDNNPNSHFYDIKRIRTLTDYEIWETYMYKEAQDIQIASVPLKHIEH